MFVWYVDVDVVIDDVVDAVVYVEYVVIISVVDDECCQCLC